MDSKYPTFNLARFAAEIVSTLPKPAPVVVKSRSEEIAEDYRMGWFEPSRPPRPGHESPLQAALNNAQYLAAREFMKHPDLTAFSSPRFHSYWKIMLEHRTGVYYTVILNRSGAPTLYKDGVRIVTDESKWTGSAIQWLLLHIS